MHPSALESFVGRRLNVTFAGGFVACARLLGVSTAAQAAAHAGEVVLDVLQIVDYGEQDPWTVDITAPWTRRLSDIVAIRLLFEAGELDPRAATGEW